MKKFIKKIFGIHAGAKNVNGRKSSGVEDFSGYKNWAERRSSGTRDTN